MKWRIFRQVYVILTTARRKNLLPSVTASQCNVILKGFALKNLLPSETLYEISHTRSRWQKYHSEVLSTSESQPIKSRRFLTLDHRSRFGMTFEGTRSISAKASKSTRSLTPPMAGSWWHRDSLSGYRPRKRCHSERSASEMKNLLQSGNMGFLACARNDKEINNKQKTR